MEFFLADDGRDGDEEKRGEKPVYAACAE